MEFEGQLLAIDLRGEFALAYGDARLVSQCRQPDLQEFRKAITNRARSTAELGARRREKAAAVESAELHVIGPGLHQRTQPPETARLF